MAFLVLALSVMPCADIGVAANDGIGKTELSKTSNPKDQQQPDDCSPFCHCTCCAGFSINHFIADLTQTPEYECDPTSGFLPAAITGIASSIWQPPQLV